MIAFRNSQLRLRRLCGFAYACNYMVPTPEAPVAALSGGRSIHSAAQLLVRRIVEGGPIDIHDIAFRTVQGGTAEYADALRVLTRMQEAIGTEFDIDPKAVIVLEEKLSMQLTLRDGRVVEFYGTPDLVQRIGKGACRIDDWKSQWAVQTQDEFEADQQLPRYALLVFEAFPAMKTFQLFKRFVRWENSNVSMTITRDHLPQIREALISEIEATLELDEAGVFEPAPGEWCALCAFHAKCPRIREYLDTDRDIDVPSIADDDHARSLAADAHALECAADRIKGTLKRYLGDHPKGYVPLPGGGFYGYGPKQHREADYHAVAEALRDVSIEPPAELASLSMKAYDRVVKRLPETAVQRAEKLFTRWQSPEFRFRRTIPSEITLTPASSEPEELL